MNKFSLTIRLILLLTMPLLGVIAFGGRGAWEKYSVTRDYARLHTSNDVLNEIGNFVHELQKERGRAAAFVGSKGAKFTSELAAQQKASDTAFAVLQKLIPSFDAQAFGGQFTSEFNNAFRAVGELQAKRQAIADFAITAAESTAYFTQTIALLLDVLVSMSHYVSDAEIATGIGSYVYYLQAKEQAGIERAVLTGVFSADKFTGDALGRVNQSVAAQETFLRVFRSQATLAQRTTADETVRGPVVEAAAAMRQTALARAETGAIGIDSAAWFDAITGKIDLMRKVEETLAADYIASAQRIGAAAERTLIVYTSVTAAILCATAAFGAWVIRSIARPLNRVIGELTANADQTTAAAGQVSASSQSLANGANEQASSLEETSASLEEMASMTKRNAESAQAAKELSAQTRTSADTGAAHMEEMRRAMDAIKASSNDVGKIIKTIDEIAFQTNILALNAAVEAARAGEAGMGFAVVAEEVRNLARRSAKSAGETAEKIEDAIRKSEHGVTISGSVAQSLSDIVEKARKVDALVAEIAQASTEQSQGIGQLNSAVSQMDKITQSNASNAEETAAAAEELTAQASSMRSTVTSLENVVRGERDRLAEAAGNRPMVIPSPAKQKTARQSQATRALASTARAEESLRFDDYEPIATPARAESARVRETPHPRARESNLTR